MCGHPREAAGSPRAVGRGLGLEPGVLPGLKPVIRKHSLGPQSVGWDVSPGLRSPWGTIAWESPSRVLAHNRRRGPGARRGGALPLRRQRQEWAGWALRMGQRQQTWPGPGCPEQWGHPLWPVEFSWLLAHRAHGHVVASDPSL